MVNGPVLHLDTTTAQLHVGLSQAGEILFEDCLPCESHRYHSAMLVPAIQELLASAGLTVNDLTALAVNQGPGSFTGIRTGVITARTMAQFLQVPVYQFNTFELLAAGHDSPVAVYLDALRGRAYHAHLHIQSSGTAYQQPPTLVQLDTATLPEAGTQCLISPTLTEYFLGRTAQPVSEGWRPQAAMLRLMSRAAAAYEQEWSAVRPLYIQEPSITLKKKS
ncbi:tRNA (adenosine(37)-N6)-threonylcarbamoyltransferase complex dimerization subunit type 1 TsaB [Vampirovibrio chlorellavorus]|uniref:tRNA (adenosine(37)-N6)-threonylcarbamoyltransferase complex dimerization subunit type 1 TsaB n=1 Tax=Vampirovibrio chlorellavorus TaxID=758823 RepID=UPI0026E97A4B|nr:tRNA (adenosine(37)-N6)-threonylcarbamoyltransferase complex dimerization subunit type 1 TsaB [Vampirovibrio chlorellavorus]